MAVHIPIYKVRFSGTIIKSKDNVYGKIVYMRTGSQKIPQLFQEFEVEEFSALQVVLVKHAKLELHSMVHAQGKKLPTLVEPGRLELHSINFNKHIGPEPKTRNQNLQSS